MKKTLAILLLLSLVVGCGSDDQKALDDNTAARNANTEAIQAKNKTNQSSGENENPLLEDERPAGKKALPKNDLSAALSGKRLHFKIDGESIWAEFHSDGSSYRGQGEKQAPGEAQWSVSGNRVKILSGIDDDYLVFPDLTTSKGSEVIGLASADKANSEGVKGTIVRVEPIPPASVPPNPGPQPTASQTIFPVAGTITYDGKPLTGALIRLEATGRRASRVYACDSKPNGTFEIVAVYSTGVKSGAPIGKYKVLVGKWEKDETDSDELGFEEALELELIEEESEVAPAPKSLILEKFSKPSLTPLKLEVKEGKNYFTIKLKSDGTGTVKAL